MFKRRSYQKKYIRRPYSKRLYLGYKRRHGYSGPSLKGIIGAPNGLYNQRFNQRQEQKFNDIIIGTTSTSGKITSIQLATGDTVTGTALNGIPEGTDYTNRVGRNITMKSLYINGQFYVSPTGATDLQTVAVQNMGMTENLSTGVYSGQNTLVAQGEWLRILVVYDLQTNGITPSIGDVLYANFQSSGVTTVSTVDTMSFANLNYRDRFKILIDKKIPMHGFANNATVQFKKYKKLSSGVTYSGPDFKTGSIATGGLFIYIFSWYGSVRGELRCRLRFTDA